MTRVMTIFPSSGVRIDFAALALANREREENGFPPLTSLDGLDEIDIQRYRCTVNAIVTAYYDGPYAVANPVVMS